MYVLHDTMMYMFTPIMLTMIFLSYYLYNTVTSISITDIFKYFGLS